MAHITKLKKRYPLLHALLVFTAIATLTWGIWEILEHFFFPNMPVFRGILAFLLGLLLLLIDDFKLNELHEE